MAWENVVRQTSAGWAANNPTLLDNQMGIESNIRNGVETDTGMGKVGNGVTAWNDLPYWVPSSISQNSQTGNYTLALSDIGKHILETGAGKTITIPANSSVAFPIGSAISFIATDAGGCSIAITTDTMTLANSTTTGTRTLAQNGVATAIKIAATSWIISGVGLT